MNIHLVEVGEKQTACGRSIKRLWWVHRSHWVGKIYGNFGGLAVKFFVDSNKDVTCKACKKEI